MHIRRLQFISYRHIAKTRLMFKIHRFVLFVVILLLNTLIPFVNCWKNPYCNLHCQDDGGNYIQNTVCNRDYIRCGPGPNCGPQFKQFPMTNNLREYILDLHNQLRNNVAQGLERRNRQPSASNMNVLVYDKELEFMMQCWVNECNGSPLRHDKCRRTSKFDIVGQNIAMNTMSSSSRHDYNEIVEKFLRTWYDEVAYFANRKLIVPYRGNSYPDTLHYTQLVWGNTTHLGCAGAEYITYTARNRRWYNFLFGCNYGSGGNRYGIPMYDIGRPCSKCGVGKSCSLDYRSLCGQRVSVANSNKGYAPYFPI